MAKDISEVLRSIGVAGRLDNIKAALQTLRQSTIAQMIEPTQPNNPEAAAGIKQATATLESEISLLQEQLVECADRIERYETWADEALPIMLETADMAIYDVRTADDATRSYNADWFSRLLLSQEAKQRFARHLFRLIRQYSKANTDTLRKIGEGDPAMLELIDKPIED